MSKVLNLWSGMTGAVLPFAGSTAPNGWLLCFGQAVSRTTYENLFAILGTTYGVGDGSTTFTLPDLRGRVPAGKDDMGGTAASRLNVTQTGTRASTSSGVITGLADTSVLSVGMAAFGTDIPAGATIATIDTLTQITLSANSASTGSGSIRFGLVDGATLGAAGGNHVHKLHSGQMPGHSHGSGANNGFWVDVGGRYIANAGGSVINLNNVPTTANTGGDQSHPNLQPSIVLNHIIKT